MAKRNVCILESFFSLGATDEGRWQRSWSIAALMLLIRDRSRALAVCLCLLKPVSRGFLRRLLFLLRASLLPICLRSREFSTTILVCYARAWSLMWNLGGQWTERRFERAVLNLFSSQETHSVCPVQTELLISMSRSASTTVKLTPFRKESGMCTDWRSSPTVRRRTFTYRVATSIEWFSTMKSNYR